MIFGLAFVALLSCFAPFALGTPAPPPLSALGKYCSVDVGDSPFLFCTQVFLGSLNYLQTV
jgi:hypothetical protein